MKTSAKILLAVSMLGAVPLFSQGQESMDAAAVVESLLFGLPMAPSALTSGLPADARQSLVKYRDRATQFKPTIKRPAGVDSDGPTAEVYQKHVDMQRTVFSLFERADSIRLAEGFSNEVILAYEWEGFSDGPLAEAASAVAFLAAHPNSPIQPYAHLFIGHRRLCAVSSYTGVDPTTPEARRILTDADRELAMARDAGHPLLRVAAEYLLRTRKCMER
jgi:hypothetical protein